MLGPQDDYFTPEAIATFLGSALYRHAARPTAWDCGSTAPALSHAKGYNIVSDGIAPGAIQVPGNGLPIVLLADRQSTGGYPKIATVVSADLAALGRVSPGYALRFTPVTVELAQTLRREQEAWLRGLPGELRPVRNGEPDLARLMSANLVSGVVDAQGDSAD